ncbi:MFS transporter [Streptomyces sp. NPDC002523]
MRPGCRADRTARRVRQIEQRRHRAAPGSVTAMPPPSAMAQLAPCCPAVFSNSARWEDRLPARQPSPPGTAGSPRRDTTRRAGDRRSRPLHRQGNTAPSAGPAAVAAALAGDWPVLIGARAAQGVGAALMLPASLATITELYPEPRERSRALGVWGSGMGSPPWASPPGLCSAAC